MREEAHDQGAIARRFRGYLPVVMDIETSGFNANTDAILEIGASIVQMDADGRVRPGEVIFHHVEPFPGAHLDPSSLSFTGIDPFHPFRFAIHEREALADVFRAVRRAVRETGCQRAVLVAHNAAFDQSFLNAAISRNRIKRRPFHPFSALDTASLAALAYGQTVLRRACQSAGIAFDPHEAHSACYDVARAADLFCAIVNRYRDLGGWPLSGDIASMPVDDDAP